jgi:3-dehydroquinate synthetase
MLRRAALQSVSRLLKAFGPGENWLWQPGAGAGTAASAPAPTPWSTSDGLVEARRVTRVSFPVVSAPRVLDPREPALTSYLPPEASVLAVVDDFSPAVTAEVHTMLAERHRLGGIRAYAVLPVRSSPRRKTLRVAQALAVVARRMGLGTGDRILAVGGGTVLDLVGHVAAFHPGGTPYLRVPTTLVGLVDAGVGLKVGVDVDGRKNLVGSYHAPLACLDDAAFLTTLPDAEFRCGLAEIIKIALVCDARLFTLVDTHHDDLLRRRSGPVLDEVLRRAVDAMLRELERNPLERRLRRLPDFGHEFGHVLEERSGFRLRHGEAVAVGMALSCQVATFAGRLDPAVTERLLRLLSRVGLPWYDPCCDAGELWRALHSDVLPHKGGMLHLVVPTRIGAGGYIDSIDDISPALLRRAWATLRDRPS